MRDLPKALHAPQAPTDTTGETRQAFPTCGRDRHREIAGLPGHVVDDFLPDDAAEAHCPTCESQAPYAVRQMLFTLPTAGFSLIGRGGVCVRCDTMIAIRRVSFDAIAAAWEGRPAGTDRFVLLVHRSGESESAFQLRVAARLDDLAQLTAATLGAFAPLPPHAIPREAVPREPAPVGWEAGAGAAEIFGWLPGTRQ